MPIFADVAEKGQRRLNRPIRQEIIEESIVIPPSTRMLWICSRQNHHHLRCDAEELGLAGGGIDEVGYADRTAAGTADCTPLAPAQSRLYSTIRTTLRTGMANAHTPRLRFQINPFH